MADTRVSRTLCNPKRPVEPTVTAKRKSFERQYNSRARRTESCNPYSAADGHSSKHKSTQQRSARRNTMNYSTVVPHSSYQDEQSPRRRKELGFQKVLSRSNYNQTTGTQEMPTQFKPCIDMTVRLVQTYEHLNPQFRYDPERCNPRRVLTRPSKPTKNDGYDNENCDYILKVNDILGNEIRNQYRVIDLLGSGTFGQVAKCEKVDSKKLYSVKIIKNKAAYRAQACVEIEILNRINQKLDPNDEHHLLRLQHTFNHKNHLCLVSELLSYSLFDLIKENRFKGLPLGLIQVITRQLLDALSVLKEGNIIHCDLKPENILLQNINSPAIKVIDFGSACHKANRMYTYIQSRFYRSPEVLLGLQYTTAIDIWSLGCIVAELYLGLPLFPGISEYNQLKKIIDMLGMPPQDMLIKGTNTLKFFAKEPMLNGRITYKLKTREQYSRDIAKKEMIGKRYFKETNLPDLIVKHDDKVSADGVKARQCLLDFVQGVLELDPSKRWTPQQAKGHPFITGDLFQQPNNQEIHSVASNRSSRSIRNSQCINTNQLSKRLSREIINDVSPDPIHPLDTSVEVATMSSNFERSQNNQKQQESFFATNHMPSQSHPEEECLITRQFQDIQDTAEHPIQNRQHSGHNMSIRVNGWHNVKFNRHFRRCTYTEPRET